MRKLIKRNGISLLRQNFNSIFFKTFGLIFCVAFTLLWPIYSLSIQANDEEQHYENDDTGYEAYVVDGADWLTKSEEKKLLSAMESLTEYCNVIYLTDDNNRYESESYSESLSASTLKEYFHSQSAVIYLVDNEYDYIYAQGEVGNMITVSKAYSITDNVYTFSVDKEFYEGAVEAFSEIETVIKGEAIAQPMKYVCNAFLGIFIALFVNYEIVNKKSKLKRASVETVVGGANSAVNAGPVNVQFINQTRTYAPRSSSGGGHGGGGHGGGGHSGGGGGHGGGHSH